VELRTARFCKNLLGNFNALWTFLEYDDVEPTNNHAERSLRVVSQIFLVPENQSRRTSPGRNYAANE
jgi:hypothetical protein